VKFDDGTGDPHIGGTWDDAPEYVVSFWTHEGDERTAWSQAWEIVRDADADEVLEWATAEAAGRHYPVWVRSVGLWHDGTATADAMRLVGTDPPPTEANHPGLVAPDSWSSGEHALA
jgi:hypothetical protein